MKTLNDFKKENKDLNKLEMASKIGGLAEHKPEITAAEDSNWNCGDVKTCRDVVEVGGGVIVVCETKELKDPGN